MTSIAIHGVVSVEVSNRDYPPGDESQGFVTKGLMIYTDTGECVQVDLFSDKPVYIGDQAEETASDRRFSRARELLSIALGGDGKSTRFEIESSIRAFLAETNPIKSFDSVGGGS